MNRLRGTARTGSLHVQGKIVTCAVKLGRSIWHGVVLLFNSRDDYRVGQLVRIDLSELMNSYHHEVLNVIWCDLDLFLSAASSLYYP